ncbi:LysM peptidoglycan-binding domain-containing protein [Robertmurraya sp. DFI.2.37]|uniref:LysM peptidoglycan-binding domain-containing protein n=1 Tax=Robertmurraya sp. DFI.2.37 TaxID=3031819 RepID=UPI0012452B85|nr:LysM peptidoglycan-binding domain-containing protein [Robertmurraya sp. DFI.2.37]MDF1507688.1 LysM peptidoglycan-binding domain-containing protein [Robertmurraya sp. DFI.2.37]
MNKEEPYRDQAERLRKRISKKEESETINDSSQELPPRSRVHYQKAKRTKVKLKYPLIRLLAIFFILLPIVSFSIYSINESKSNRSASVDHPLAGNIEAVDVKNDEPSEQGMEEERTGVDLDEDLPEIEEDEVVGEPESEKVEPVKVDSTLPEKESPNDKAPVKEEIIYHTVQTGETLFRISMKYYQSQSGIEIIREANGIQGNEIRIGQTLKIPIEQ